MTRIISIFFNEAFIRSWWVIGFSLCCFTFYEQGMHGRKQDYTKLYAQYIDLKKDEKIAQTIQQDLSKQINSQSDPAWVELTLMKGLGLVPEGQIKVIFN